MNLDAAGEERMQILMLELNWLMSLRLYLESQIATLVQKRVAGIGLCNYEQI